MINAQIRSGNEKKNEEDKKNRFKDRLTYFPFTHGDAIEQQRCDYKEEIRAELKSKEAELLSKKPLITAEMKEQMARRNQINQLKLQILEEEKKHIELKNQEALHKLKDDDKERKLAE